MMDGQDESAGSKALVRFENKLWMARKGENEDTRIFISSFNGSEWSAGVAILGISTGSSPALAALEAELYLIWWDEHSNTIHWAKSCDGSSWQLQAPLPDEHNTNVPPSAGLYLAWKASLRKQRHPAVRPFTSRPFLVPRAK
jgi:hypothetical protein